MLIGNTLMPDYFDEDFSELEDAFIEFYESEALPSLTKRFTASP